MLCCHPVVGSWSCISVQALFKVVFIFNVGPRLYQNNPVMQQQWIMTGSARLQGIVLFERQPCTPAESFVSGNKLAKPYIKKAIFKAVIFWDAYITPQGHDLRMIFQTYRFWPIHLLNLWRWANTSVVLHTQGFATLEPQSEIHATRVNAQQMYQL